MDQEFLHGSTFAEHFDFPAKYYELWIQLFFNLYIVVARPLRLNSALHTRVV